MKPYSGRVVYVDGVAYGIADRYAPSVKAFAQDTARWSQTGPPAAQLPVKMRKIIGLDQDWYQVGYDLSNAELRIVSTLSQDEMFLAAFAKGWDLHSLTASELFALGYPPNREKAAIHFGEDCAEWRASCDWQGEDDPRRKFAKIFIFRCVPMDTQILTRVGWKTYDTVVVGEDVLTYNADTKVKEWQPLLEKVYHESAPVVEMSNSHFFKVRSTPNHRWFVRKRRWDSLNDRWFTRPYMVESEQTTEEINFESNIIVNAPMSFDSGLGYNEWPVDKYNVDYTKAVCSMSSEQRKAFLHGFLLGEGYVRERKTYKAWNWCQNKTNIFDAMLTASFIESDGFCHVTYENRGKEHCKVNISTKGHVTGQRLEKRFVGNEPVWCPRTANGSWVMRQGDVIAITGNTLYGGSPKSNYKIPGANKLGLNRNELEQAGYRWLAAHPKLSQFWELHGMEAMKRYIVRNAFGRRRVLCSSDELARWREGINHPIQSFVSDLINKIVIETFVECNSCSSFQELRLKLQSEPSQVRLYGQMHDSLLWGFPEDKFKELSASALNIAQRVRNVNGNDFQFPVSSYTKGVKA